MFYGYDVCGEVYIERIKIKSEWMTDGLYYKLENLPYFRLSKSAYF